MRQLLTEQENVAAANSRVRDADVAKTAAESARAQILQQVQVATAAQANIASTVALSLLR